MSCLAHNKTRQPQSLRFLDRLALASFVHGFAIIAQNSQSQVCRCGRCYVGNRINSDRFGGISKEKSYRSEILNILVFLRKNRC